MKPERIDDEALLERTNTITDPNVAMSDNQSWLAYYGAQEAKWLGVVNTIKFEIENKSAILYLEFKDAFEKKPSEDALKHMVIADSDIQTLKKRLNIAIDEAKSYTNACRAFVDRGNNARSINSSLKNERTSGSATHYNMSEEDKADRKERVNSLART